MSDCQYMNLYFYFANTLINFSLSYSYPIDLLKVKCKIYDGKIPQRGTLDSYLMANFYYLMGFFAKKITMWSLKNEGHYTAGLTVVLWAQN